MTAATLDTNHPDLRALVAASLAAAPAPEQAPEHAPEQAQAQTRGRQAAAGVVIGLCAAWCGSCREFRPGFEEAALAHPNWRFRWMDVEDDADALGDVDIETFPTLVIGTRDGQVRFAGAVLPQAAQIGRLLQSLAP